MSLPVALRRVTTPSKGVAWMAAVRKPRSVGNPPLTDHFGRVHRSLRVSVTDRCNLRCRYCMPADGMAWLRRDEVASDDELVRLTSVLVALGIRDVRVTGGEPLVRAGVADIISRLRGLPGMQEISMTTNGVLLAEHIDALVDAGLDRLNVSVDSLDPGRFAQITRRNDLARVLEGLAACERHDALRPIKVNAVTLRGLSEPDVLPLARLARDRPYVVRFIEAMPIDAGRTWSSEQVIPGEELRRMIGAKWPLREFPRTRPSAPGRRWRFVDGCGELEFVSSVSEPFCASCDRLRLTADGRLRSCLFATDETDLLTPLRAGASDAELIGLIADNVAAKGVGHGIGTPGWSYEGRPMSMIGG
jgi:cyclic pyranopterin phosphate synthase